MSNKSGRVARHCWAVSSRVERNPNQVGPDQRQSSRRHQCGRVDLVTSVLKNRIVLYCCSSAYIFIENELEWYPNVEFIEMYRDRSYLWDSSDVNYKNRNKRHDGLVEIAVSFGIEKVEVEKKISRCSSIFIITHIHNYENHSLIYNNLVGWLSVDSSTCTEAIDELTQSKVSSDFIDRPGRQSWST